METDLLDVDTTRRRIVDLTDAVRSFCRTRGDGLCNIFVPHATAGVAVIETGAGSDDDLVDALERLLPRDGRYRRFIHFDFVYSSACPCSAELTEHARAKRGAYGVPHSQRSKARVTVEEVEGKKIWIEDIHALCLKALHTETQVMVKREDEQAFAELNGAYLKFVEDAARLLYLEFDRDKRIADFRIACSHLESLHSHDAVSVICKGVKGGFTADFMDFGALIC